jgi:hypothetical protein
MTRKRFVKMLMSYGIPRNRAMVIADIVNAHNVPYSKAFHSHYIAKYRIVSGWKKAMSGCCEAFSNVAEAFRRLGVALREVGGVIEKSQ